MKTNANTAAHARNIVLAIVDDRNVPENAIFIDADRLGISREIVDAAIEALLEERVSAEALRAALEAGGYGALVGREAEIKRAAKSGCLLWSSTRLTTTDASRIDERPATRAAS